MSLKRIRFSDWRVYVPVAALLIAAGVGVYMTQEPDRPKPPHYSASDLVKDCPPDHLIEFVLPPGTKLYANIRWLHPATIEEVFEQTGPQCPTGPISVEHLEFNWAVLELLDIQTGLGRPVFRFGLGGSKNPEKAASSLAESANINQYIAGARIEMNTPAALLENSITSSGRNYILHYPGGDETAEVTCAGPQGQRLCETRGGYRFDRLGVGYILSQRELPMPSSTVPPSTDPATEPGAILQFDRRLRAWIRKLQQKPS